jgi:hypothetical protein
MFMPASGLGSVGAGMEEILSSSVSISCEISSTPFAVFLSRKPGPPPFSATKSWNFPSRKAHSTSDVHLGLSMAARGWLKAIATDRTAHPVQTRNFARANVALRTFA